MQFGSLQVWERVNCRLPRIGAAAVATKMTFHIHMGYAIVVSCETAQILTWMVS